MQKIAAKERIYIRRSIKFEPIFKKIEKIASERPGGQLTSTLLEMAALGVKSYESGLRLVDDKLLNTNNESSTMNVDREVARSVFTSLAGSLIDVKRNEKLKEVPDQEKIKFYDLAAKALYFEHDRFRHFTNDDVQNVFSTIAPILKGLRLAKNKLEREQIVENNHQVLQSLITTTKVTV